ncbi:uncharacterized protein O8D03_006260 [Erethizon dorsatum]
MRQMLNTFLCSQGHQWGASEQNQIILPSGTELTTMDEFSSIYIVYEIQDLLIVIFALIGLAGNAAVLWLLGIQGHKKAISVYILNLATSDFLFLCCLLIFFMWELIDNFDYEYYLYIHAVGMCFYTTSLSMLSAISIERCLVVLFPIWYRCHRPRHMSAVTCSLLWALSLLLTVLLHISDSFPLGFVQLGMGMRFFTASCLVILFVVLCGSSLLLLVRMLCGSTRLPLTRLYVTVGLAVLVFLLCSMPLCIVSVWGDMIQDKMGIFNFIALQKAAFLLSSINSSANPIIYFFVGSFRRKQHQGHQQWSLKLVLQKALEDVGEGEKSGERLRQKIQALRFYRPRTDSAHTKGFIRKPHYTKDLLEESIEGTSGEFVSMNPTIAAGSMEPTTMNTSSPAVPPTINDEVLIPEWLIFIIALIGLAGNAIVLWFLGFHIHRNATSVYILNLAAADFLFLCSFIIFYLGKLTGNISHMYYLYLHSVGLSSYITGLSMISAISSERCLSVLFPIWYRYHRPRHTSAVTCALLWTLSLLFIILIHTLCELPFDKKYDPCLIMHFITAAWLIFLFVVLSGSSLALLIRILCGSRRLLLTRLYITLGLTVLVFLLCGLPVGILWFTSKKIHFMISNDLWSIAFFLSSLNSSADPIIYFFVGSFRQKKHQQLQQKSLKLVLQKALEDVTEEQKNGESLPQQSVEMSESL